MEKQVTNIHTVADHELDAITGGAGGEDAYSTEKCTLCQEVRSGDYWTLRDWKAAHTQNTGHNSYVQYDQ